MNFKRRVGRLEKEFNVVMEVPRMRIVVTTVKGLEEPGDGNPAPSGRAEEPDGLHKCNRYFMNGMVFESIWINGSQGDISDDEIERYVESFPIRDLPTDKKFRIAGADRKN